MTLLGCSYFVSVLDWDKTASLLRQPRLVFHHAFITHQLTSKSLSFSIKHQFQTMSSNITEKKSLLEVLEGNQDPHHAHFNHRVHLYLPPYPLHMTKLDTYLPNKITETTHHPRF